MPSHRQQPKPIEVSLYLSSSKCWWAYLAIKSNPDLFLFAADTGVDRAIFVERPSDVLSDAILNRPTTHCFYICWDGIVADSGIAEMRGLVGERLTVLAVGDSSLAVEGTYRVNNLYASGEFRFTAPSVRFDARTSRKLLRCRINTLLMPFKNLLQPGSNLAQGLDLLLGRKRIVFCGSYGTVPKVIAELCERHSVEPRLFDGYRYYCDVTRPSFATYQEYLQINGLFLGDLFDRGEIPGRFFHSAVHLLGREYFVEKIRCAGLPLFAHGYALGVNINVYTTPFYAQHVFLDFGSAVGRGNYPRLADLRYFRKTVVELEIDDGLETTAELARRGALEERFEEEWALKSPQLIEAIR